MEVTLLPLVSGHVKSHSLCKCEADIDIVSSVFGGLSGSAESTNTAYNNMYIL